MKPLRKPYFIDANFGKNSLGEELYSRLIRSL